MKITSILKSAFAIMLAGFVTLSACSSDTGKTAAHNEIQQRATGEEGNPKFSNKKVKLVYEHYIHLKNALVKADTKATQVGAAALQNAFTEVGNKSGANIAAKIAHATKLETQRTELDALTTEVEKVIKSSKLLSGKIYKQYCPMAKDGDGGYWLASESAIKNPYYGDEMLECGEVKEEIK